MTSITNPKNPMEIRSWGKRDKVICGKIPVALHKAVKSLVEDGKFATVNDFVEEAVFEKWKKVQGTTVEGC